MKNCKSEKCHATRNSAFLHVAVKNDAEAKGRRVFHSYEWRTPRVLLVSVGKAQLLYTVGVVKECAASCGHSNPLTAGAEYIRVFVFFINHVLNMLKIKCDINQEDLKRIDLHFVKSE